MLALHGTGVSSGIVIGKAHVLQRELPEIPRYTVGKHQIDAEIARFTRAVEAARSHLQNIRARIPADAPREAASFLDTHLLILDDPTISQAPVEMMRRHRRNAEWALEIERDHLRAQFESMEDPYLREKGRDVQHVVERVLRAMLLPEDDGEHEVNGDIVVADDLTPADTVLLKQHRVRAFVTDQGGPISHTAILARSLGIPAIVSLHNATRYVRAGERIIVDGKRGVLIVNPDEFVAAEYGRLKAEIAEKKRELARLRTRPSITRDKRRVHLYANIELPGDVNAALQAGAEGIGLYRTEFMFMNRAQPPSEEEQFRTYSRIVTTMRGKPVTIRTLDLGADKQVEARRTESGQIAVNPALGLRAVRLCLADPSLFRPQLRAILRASALGKVRMMIPMLSAQEEMFQVLELIDQTKHELKKRRERFNARLSVGGMIEVPAAAISADLFASHLDFFSIGTNDLIQYTLAIDRVDDAVNYLYDPLHPSVLRLISLTIEAGKKARIPVAMCGEMAGDARYTRLLLGLGLAEFSMHPATLLDIKRLVRESRATRLGKQARRILGARSTRQVHEWVEQLNEGVSL
jgi:phosphoenolpyruvate-protein phosphotransferase (PTS system enzyme I)